MTKSLEESTKDLKNLTEDLDVQMLFSQLQELAERRGVADKQALICAMWKYIFND